MRELRLEVAELFLDAQTPVFNEIRAAWGDQIELLPGARQRRWREARKAKNLCPKCGEKALEGKVQCGVCK